MRANVIRSQLPNILAFAVIVFALIVGFGSRYLVATEKSITVGCAEEFCVGQDQATADAVIATAENNVQQILKSSPFDVLHISTHAIENNQNLSYDRMNYWLVVLKTDRGWEKHMRLKFKNDEIVEIDIKSYGPLSVS